MPLKLLLDENLRSDSLWWAIAQHNEISDYPLDIVRVGDKNGPALGVSDPELIAWAASAERILIGLDTSTLPRHLDHYCGTNNRSPGAVFLRGNLSNAEVVELLTLVAHVTAKEEWADTYRWIP